MILAGSLATLSPLPLERVAGWHLAGAIGRERETE